MKLTDGAFQNVFVELSRQYPSIQTEHQIVDIATARIAAHPERYDVVVTLNLYGDILSDVAAEVAGSVGLAGSANIGERAAMFEAVHGSAPDLARDVANPCGMLNGSVMMLNYLGQHAPATLIHNAMLRTLEDGVHTADVAGPLTTRRVGTAEFARAVIERLGSKPTKLPVVEYTGSGQQRRKDVRSPAFHIPESSRRPVPKKELVGVDVFVDWDPKNVGRNPNKLAEQLNAAVGANCPFKLKMISNRGVLVWPGGHPDTYKVDHWRCRFEGPTGQASVLPLLQAIEKAGLEIVKTETLFLFDGEAGYSKGQGQ